MSASQGTGRRGSSTTGLQGRGPLSNPLGGKSPRGHINLASYPEPVRPPVPVRGVLSRRAYPGTPCPMQNRDTIAALARPQRRALCLPARASLAVTPVCVIRFGVRRRRGGARARRPCVDLRAPIAGQRDRRVAGLRCLPINLQRMGQRDTGMSRGIWSTHRPNQLSGQRAGRSATPPAPSTRLRLTFRLIRHASGEVTCFARMPFLAGIRSRSWWNFLAAYRRQ